MNNQEREKLKSTKKGFWIIDPDDGYWLNINGIGNGYTREQSKAGVFPLEYILKIRTNCPSMTIIELK